MFAAVEIILAFLAIAFLVWGNILGIGGISQTDVLAIMVLAMGFLTSAFYFLFALLVTVTNKDDPDNKDMIFANMVATPLLVGVLFTIGSFLDALPNTQSIFLDAGLIIGLFFIFITIYMPIKEKIDFLEIEDIDVIAGTDKEKYPQFFLATIMLGIIYAIPFIIFKVWYLNFGYNSTAYLFLGVIFIYAIVIAFGHEIVSLFKKLFKKE